MLDKLQKYAMIIGVVSAIGGGFYAWGVFENRIAQLENAEFTITQTVDLQPVYEKIDLVEGGLIQRQDGFVDKIDSAKDVLMQRQSEKVREINTNIAKLSDLANDNGTNLEVLNKELELLKLKIEEIELNNTNPLR